MNGGFFSRITIVAKVKFLLTNKRLLEEIPQLELFNCIW
jgi:hypothetical protein